ncbi:MAG: nuclear transport factor 2 family protein [Thermoanaerobaculia bacterium]
MTGEETRKVLARFYDALARRDARTLAGMYAPDAAFEDPVFRLCGDEIGRMWERLLGRAREFSVAYTIARAAHDEGTVEWTARYLFGGKHPVVNVILSELRFRDGLIVTQKDVFDFPRWAAQALGPAGRWLGGFEWFRRSVRRRAREGLGISISPS